ncbi:MAG: LysR family transcriptional regulator, partial [Cyanobacteria bacterium P01_F01_bin.42]
MTFHWDDIRIFLSVVRNGSLPQAAKDLKMAHSTVFRRLNGFEEQIGVRLFDRASSGFILTEAGEAILDMAQEMEDRSEQIARAIAGRDYALTGTIRVTTTHGLSLKLMEPVFKKFTDQHPSVCLDIQWGEQVLKLNKYETDVIILPSKKPPENAFGRKVGKIILGYFASTAYLEKHGTVRTVDDLSDHHVVGLSDEFMGQPFYTPFINSIQAARVTITCDSFLTVREAIASGAGVGILPYFYGMDYKNLQTIGEPITQGENDVWILTHRDLKNTVRIR